MPETNVQPPLPPDEAARLAVLRSLEILDTASEESFDELTALAASICQTPIALVSLIDQDRQWFKSRFGWAATATPRDVSFCAHTILRQDLLIVPDASADERFASSPLVTSDPGIRFYAGAPLVTPEGHALGSLCVIDRRPRQLTAEQAQALRILSRQIMALVQRRRHVAELERITRERLQAEQALSQERSLLHALLDHIPDKIYFKDAQSRFLRINKALATFFGLADPAEAIGKTDFDFFTEEHARPAHEDEQEILRTGRPVIGKEEKGVHLDGRMGWVSTTKMPLRDTDGAIIGTFGVSRNITKLKLTEEALAHERDLLHTLLDNLPDNIYFKDVGGRFVRINKALTSYFGLSDPAQAIGKTDFDFFTEEHARLAREDELHIVRTGEPLVGKEEKETWLDGHVRWVSSTKMPFRDPDGRITGTFGVSRDITKLKRTEEALRESEQRWRSLTEALPQLVWSATPDGACDYFSTQWTEHTGVAEADLLGWRWLETLHPDDREPTRQFWLESVAGRHPYDVEYRVRRHDGEYRWFKTRGVPIRDGSGNIVKWFGTCTDITDLRQTEEALRASEQRFRIFVDHAADGFFLFDQQSRILDVNRLACETLGYTRDEILGMTPFDFDPDVAPAGLEEIKRKLLAGETIAFETRHRRKEGTSFPVEVRGKSFWDSGQQRTVTLARDITDRKRAEEALRESEERFRGTFENAAVGIAHTDLDGRWLRVNEKFCAILGYTVEELTALHNGRLGWQDLTHPEDLPASAEQLTALLKGERSSYSLEKRYVHKGGSVIWGQLDVSLQRDAAGRPAYVIAVMQNVSERRRLDAELRQAKEAAEAANRAKDEFLANVSHEIRTPMNAILGMTELVLDTPLTEDQRQCLRTVKSAADNLLGLINDLLDFSKIEAGKMELAPGDFSLRSAVGDTLRALAVRAHTKGLELIYQVQPDVPDALVGDAGRLRQVLLNLVSNAVKFTEEGEVDVCVEVDGRPLPPSPEEVGLRFTVRDTGIGIPRDKQERIFRAFEQEDASTTRKYEGTGLGLTIASRLAALMGGTITVDSEPGRGSTFAFTARFALQPNPTEPITARPPVLLHGLRVLIVDDNATNRRILEEWVRAWQMEPAAVGDGLAALDALWDAVSAGRPYALVLLDARMPDTDGLALAAKIRKRAELSSTRIILLTSGDRPGDLARSREQRVDAHLLKPVQQDELLETIYRVMSRGDALAASGRREPADSLHQPAHAGRSPAALPLRVLAAEDYEFNAQLLEQLLRRRGCRVRLANNGREALRLAEEGGFDLLLLDLHMPELDGFQVARAIREHERTAGGRLPIIALTARSRKEDRDRCLAAGMDDFLAKPIRAADLWAAMDRVVGAGLPEPVPPPADGETELGLLDPRVLLAACAGDAAILEGICRAFRAGLPGQLRAVQDALRDRNAPRLREAAHKLAGMVSVFSTTAGGTASDLEDRAADGRLEEAEPLAARLAAMAEELLRGIDRLSLETLQRGAGVADPGQTGP